MEIAPPFPGPVALDAYGRPRSNPVSLFAVIGALGLTAVAAGGIYMGRRIQTHGRLLCAGDNFTVGVPLDYDKDWWEDRGRRLYYQARRDGQTVGEEIALTILRSEVSGTESGNVLNLCMAQFPPHSETHPRNVEFWQGLMEHILTEMGQEPPRQATVVEIDGSGLSLEAQPAAREASISL